MTPEIRRALIVGGGGQLGRALQLTAPDGVQVIAPSRAELDVGDQRQLSERIRAEPAIGLIINAAAYTAVDRAESEPEEARRVNVDGARRLAATAQNDDHNRYFVHVSTDFIFDGAASRPYKSDDTPNPLGVYGRTKLEGEAAVQSVNRMAVIVRTAWVYAAWGQNFVRTMLRVMRERDEVRVVADQVGTPTHARSLARAIWHPKIYSGGPSVRHWTDAGICSWYDFAVAIQEEALSIGLLGRAVPVIPIRTEDYHTPAQRPAYSVLDKTETWAETGSARHWRAELRDCLCEMKELDA